MESVAQEWFYVTAASISDAFLFPSCLRNATKIICTTNKKTESIVGGRQLCRFAICKKKKVINNKQNKIKKYAVNLLGTRGKC